MTRNDVMNRLQRQNAFTCKALYSSSLGKSYYLCRSSDRFSGKYRMRFYFSKSGLLEAIECRAEDDYIQELAECYDGQIPIVQTMWKQVLDRYGAGGDLMETEGETSSYTIVLAVPGLDRLFVHCPGANDTFSAADIPEDALESAALFHFGYPTLMRRMYENGGAELKAMFRHMKEKGIATSLDLTVPDPAGDAGKADWKGILREVLPYTDFFVPSFEELCFMLDREKYERIGKTAGNDEITKYVSLEADIIPLAEACLELGANAVLIKCGAPGMYLCCSGHMERVGQRLELDASAWNGYRAFEKSFRIDRVLSATGAGDTSIAAFLTSILKGSGPKEALENASAEGALCCTSYDSVSRLLPLEEVRKRIEAGWEKTEVNL